MKQANWWQTEENDTVATKPELWRPISRAISGFDLDPAAGCEPTPIANKRYTVEDDGMIQPWHGTVWLNPPFSKKEQWYRRLVSQFNRGNVDRAVAVAKADTSTDWFHNWFSTATVICYLDKRNWFIGNGDNPTFATMVGAWNPTDELVDTLHGFGTVVEPLSKGTQTTLGQ